MLTSPHFLKVIASVSAYTAFQPFLKCEAVLEVGSEDEDLLYFVPICGIYLFTSHCKHWKKHSASFCLFYTA